jgi:threonine dehydrogenase-like Zn-dependent dehydrogenase
MTTPPRRSTGRNAMARALWYTASGAAELRPEPLLPPKPDEARVKALYSGISRGTERLVSQGLVGESEWERMRAPFQGGQFPFPVKYGYCAVGEVTDGPKELQGQRVFCLYPHQEQFNAPVTMLTPVPQNLPAKRATLAANAETALNALWDGGAAPGHRIAVVGGGIVGLLIAHFAGRIAGADVTLIDVDPRKADLARALGVGFAKPADAPRECDLAFHTSVTQAGLNTAIDLLGLEGTVVELSWFGDKPVSLALGGPFHSKRLKVVSSQVGQVAPSQRPRWSYRRRVDKALELLADARLDALVVDEIPFDEAAQRVPVLLAENTGLAPVIKY